MNAEPVKILVVDDHQMMRQGLRLLIKEQPDLTVVGEASSCEAALEMTRTLAPQVILMDVHLPGESGIEVSRKILTEFPKIRIIILSADPDLNLVHQALLAGVAGYVTKTNGWEEVLRAIRTVQEFRVYFSPEIASAVVNDYRDTLNGKPASGKPSLSERERLLLKLVAEGKRNKEIALTLDVAVKSVETYRSRLMKKLDCASAADLTRYAIREGITTA
jgi:DNA-binding NarL/FixJ family response regulator